MPFTAANQSDEEQQLREPMLPEADALLLHADVEDNEEVAAEDEERVMLDDEEELFVKGKVQEPAYRDVWFAVAFCAQSLGVLICSVVYGREFFLLKEHTDDDTTHHRLLACSSSTTRIVTGLTTLLVASLLGAAFSTMGLLSIMTRYSHLIVEISFAAAPILLLLLGGVFMAVADPTAGLDLLLVGLFCGAISACIYLCYKRYIPFAASTLKTAVSAVQVHRGLVGVAFGSQIVTFLVSTIFFLSTVGLYLHADRVGEKVPCSDSSENGDSHDDMCLKNPPFWGIILLLFCSLWTQQVIQNVVHCTTAGTVGSWWFAPGVGVENDSFCSREIISGSFGRAATYSFGSICFGSLLVAILQTLERMAEHARRRRGNGLLTCVLQCILSLMGKWLEYFNSWAFVYVGLYGYDYLTAGKNVVSLFGNRGWSTFVSDRLIFRVLNFGVLAIAMFTGGFAALSDALLGSPSLLGDDTHLAAFCIGFVMGLFLARCSMFVVESAVRTVIISFAESPAEFAQHHPELCETMKAGWAVAYPDVWSHEYDMRFEYEVVTATPLPPPEPEDDKETFLP